MHSGVKRRARIAYIGPAAGTSVQRARALERLGHHVEVIDPWKWLSRPHLRARIHFHSGYAGVGLLIGHRLETAVRASRPDIVWVNQGEFLGQREVGRLKRLGVPVINYANDNPFSAENRRRFRLYRTALPLYDLVVVVFADAVDAAQKAGARRVIRKFISADDRAHRPRTIPEELRQRYASEVAFVGTWKRGDRGPFVAELIRRGVPLSIWGDRWNRARQWRTIEPHWRGPGIYDEGAYAAALQSAKISLGLVNERSGNLHTDRSIQVPALGSLLCAKRTSEHLELYEDGEEAVFWSDAAECANLCRTLLSDEPRRREIARRGRARVLRNNLFNEPVLASILKEFVG